MCRGKSSNYILNILPKSSYGLSKFFGFSCLTLSLDLGNPKLIPKMKVRKDKNMFKMANYDDL